MASQSYNNIYFSLYFLWLKYWYYLYPSILLLLFMSCYGMKNKQRVEEGPKSLLNHFNYNLWCFLQKCPVPSLSGKMFKSAYEMRHLLNCFVQRTFTWESGDQILCLCGGRSLEHKERYLSKITFFFLV